MRTLAAALLVLLLGACSSGDESGEDDGVPASEAPSSSGSAEAPSEESSDLSATEACAEVRAGIDAYNLGDLDETVARFEAAIPLAEELVASDPGSGADLLLEAIRYYAALPAEEYAEASPSPDFQKYKVVTLTACAYGSAPVEPDAPGDSDTGIDA